MDNWQVRNLELLSKWKAGAAAFWYEMAHLRTAGDSDMKTAIAEGGVLAKLHEEVLVIKVSKLVKDTVQGVNALILDIDAITSLESVVQELAGPGVLVEIETA